MQSEPDARTPGPEGHGWEADGTMTRLAPHDPRRAGHVARVRADIEAGRYHPPAEAVAERLLAFLGPAGLG